MDLTKEEVDSMVLAFRKMGFEPKADSTTDLKAWIQAISQQDTTSLKTESKDDHQPTAKATDKTSMGVMYHQFPRLPFFSGEPGKDSEYDLWKYEVDCLLESGVHGQDTILQAIRKSLKGEAALVAMKLGSQASTASLLTKLKSAFGTIRRSSVLMSEFYSIRQREDEDVATWSCRLDRLMFQLAKQKTIPSDEQDDMLRTRLWDGLTPRLKSIAGYKYDAIASFDELRLCLREMEFDLKRESVPRSKPKTVAFNMVATPEQSANSDMEDIKTMVKDLHAGMTVLREQQQQLSAHVYQHQVAPQSYQESQHVPRRGHRGRGRGYVSDRSQTAETYNQQYGASVRQADPTPVYSQPPAPTTTPTPQQSANSFVPPADNVPICWRCGYPGHMSYGCRVRLDHMKQPLNWHKPMGRGHH